MILGECPYDDCATSFMLEIPEHVALPAFAPWECDSCVRVIWTRYSRINPASWTEAGFHAEWDVDEATKRITARVVTNGGGT